MFSLIQKLAGYLWKRSDNIVSNEEDDLNPAELPNLISFLQCEREDKDIYKGAGLNRLTGKITHVSGDYCLIDGHYYLDLRKFGSYEMLEVGTWVTFSVFRLSDDEEWQINRVYSVGEESWDEGGDKAGVALKEEEGTIMDLEEVERTGLAQRRTLVGKVQLREGRNVTVDPGYIHFSLDEVECNVVPFIGDWLSLEVLVELDEEAGDLGGKLLKVEKVAALRARLVENGKVVQLEGPCAIINGNILAHRLSFSPGYEPSVDDHVVLQAIESDCGAGCSWRAVALAPACASLQKATIAVEKKDSEEEVLLMRDKEGMVVKGDTDFGNMAIGCEGVKVLQLCNDGPQVQWLIRSRFHGARAQSQMMVVRSDLKGVGDLRDNKPVPIYPGKFLLFEFQCKARFLGSSTELFVFTFRGFRIGRRLQVRVIDPHSDSLVGICEMPGRDLYREEYKSSRYTRSRKHHQSGAVIVPGVRPLKPPAFVPMRLPMFDVPDRLWDAVVEPGNVHQENKKSFVRTIMDVTEAVPALNSLDENGISLSPRNYKPKFHALLHLEEIEMSIRMQDRDLFGVTLRPTGPGGQFLALEVPGLAEKRPSILIGDRVLLSPSSNAMHNDKYGQKKMKFEGFVHKTFKSEVWLKFNQSFHETINKQLCGVVEKEDITEILEPLNLEWDVSFHFSRTPLRRCHLAVDLALTHLGAQFLFPMQIIKKKPQVHLWEFGDVNIKKDGQGKKSAQCEKFAVVKAWLREGNDVETLELQAPEKRVEKCEMVDSKSPLNNNRDSGSGSPEISKTVTHNVGLSADEVNLNLLTVKELDKKNGFDVTSTASSDEQTLHVDSSPKSSENTFSDNVTHRIPVVERLFGATSPSSSEPHSLKSVKNDNSTNVSLENFVSNDNNNKTCAASYDFTTDMQESIIPEHQRRTVKWFNQKLNRQQRNAVLNILKGEARPLPYVIFGPPGTGKTVTMVEAILQTLHLVPECRIMVASPSNSSANLIAERILESIPLNPGELVRLIALHCLEGGKIPSRLMPYCTTGMVGRGGMNEDEMMDSDYGGTKLRVPMSSAALGRHRVTIGTCVTLGQICTLGFPQGHFTHIFIDEAGQATEPEVLIPLGFLSTSAEIGWGQAVLAGDPRQLGPVVISRLALHLGMGQSLLSRILSSSPYSPDPIGFPDASSGHYNHSVVTRLITNYRSVPDLLSLTSEMFYDGSLLPTVSPFSGREGVLLLRMGKHLPLMKRDPLLENVQIASPLVFHGVRGEESRHMESPSWFNPMEAVQCVEYVKMLYHFAALNPEDIGIITPYVEQMKTIRNLIVDHGLPLPKVGTVEEFQGQERLAILMSSVRTSKTQVHVDLLHALGFVSSPNRLNVASSRARALLIVIGDPHLLHHDPLWNKLIKRCIESNSYVGCDLPQRLLKALDELEDDDDCSTRDIIKDQGNVLFNNL